MTSITDALKQTIAARWRHELKGLPEADDGMARTHWRTKVSYYRAMERHLNSPKGPLTWAEIVDRVVPRGNRTTFYMVIGGNAAHSLLKEYRLADRGYGRAVAELYARASAVQQLVDETKVWSYWAYRTGWLTQLELATDVTRRAAAECLVGVLADWAIQCPGTADALDFAPPPAVVEDLLVIWNRDDAAAEAHRVLRDVMRYALGPLGATTDGVLRAIRDQIYPAPWPTTVTAEENLVGGLAESAFCAIRKISALTGAARGKTRASAVTVLEDALVELRYLE